MLRRRRMNLRGLYHRLALLLMATPLIVILYTVFVSKQRTFLQIPTLMKLKRLPQPEDSPYIFKEKDVRIKKLRSVLYNNSSQQKVIAWYNPPTWINLTFDMKKRCDYYNCKLVPRKDMETADITVFHGIDLNTTEPPPRPPGQIWLVMGNEAPINYKGFLNTPSWTSVFNLTSTIRVDSDIFSPYGFLVDKDYPPLGDDWLEYFKQIARSKTRVALMLVSNCRSKSGRLEYAQELKKYLQLDILGRCGMPIQCRFDNKTCTKALIKQYVFSLAFENSLCKDYVTEKFFRLYDEGIDTIPVVRGGTDYNKYFPKGTFINAADFKTPRDLALHLNRIASNVTLIAEMLQRKARYVKKSIARECQICEYLHTNKISRSETDPPALKEDRRAVSKTYPDVFEWMISGVCHTATDIGPGQT